MTRINCGIPPAELVDKHLLAEHREIKRIPNTIKSGKARIENIPDTFTLGKGHVKFFYDKLYYLHQRYEEIYTECLKRKFNITHYWEPWQDLPEHLYNDYEPTDIDREIIRERIAIRLQESKQKKNK